MVSDKQVSKIAKLAVWHRHSAVPGKIIQTLLLGLKVRQDSTGVSGWPSNVEASGVFSCLATNAKQCIFKKR